MPTFYRMQIRDDNAGKTVADELLAQNRITSSEEYAGPLFAQLPAGTVIMVHKGGHPVALVETIQRLPDGHGEVPSFGIDYRVKILSRFDAAEVAFPPLGKMRNGIVFQGTFSEVQSGATYKYITLWYHHIMQTAALENYRALLEFKRQIILQGPPGTGKTRLAKLIADEMTKPRHRPRPAADIDKFLRTFNATAADVVKARADRQTLLADFQKAFPAASLETLPPRRYAIGAGAKDTFCYWIEYKLAVLGQYDPGSATVYLLYWDKRRERWVFDGALLKESKDAEDADAAMHEIGTLLNRIVSQPNVDEAVKHFDSRFVLKVLHSYYPSEYMPIFEEGHLDNALKLLGQEPAGMGTVEKSRQLQALFEARRQEYGANVTNDEFKDFLYKTFGLEEEVVIEMDELVAPGASTLVQFHPAYSYEDFVRGIVARVNDDGQVIYETEDKTLALLAQQALDRPAANFVLIIDEINRANLPAVLGELIYALEYRYDPNAKSKQDPKQPVEPPVQGLYALKAAPINKTGSRELRLPKNLYLIGTMNSSDRSIGHLDYAIRRRFAFEDVLPSVAVLHESIEDEALRDKAVRLFEQVEALFGPDYLAADYTPTQVQLGHSYFLADTEPTLRLRLHYEIQPLLREYLRDGVLRPEAAAEVEKLHV